MVNEGEQLKRMISEIINKRQDHERIGATSIATEVMVALRALPLRKTMPLVYHACHMQIRVLARPLLAQTFEDEEGKAQHDLFPALQRRYPIARASREEPEYVKLEAMTEEDIKFNVERLRAEAGAKLKHADALENWWNEQKRLAA